MYYFAYGSNMSIKRLKERVLSANLITIASLHRHTLRFHKKGIDGSGKCNACETGNAKHSVIGVVFDIDISEKPALDRKEGLGHGYDEKPVELVTHSGELLQAYTYYARLIDSTLKPYHWYKKHVLIGARENRLPENYIETIDSIESIPDPMPERHEIEMRLYGKF